ncbi:MAG: hypothetical protein JET69_05580 [Methanomassiliicoccales archaeon]|nr:hypothetical protein [Methanomassiliicoccales archaeon]
MPKEVKIVAQWASRQGDDDPRDAVCTVTEVGDGDVRFDVGDTVIWIPRWQLREALDRTEGN